MNIIFLWDSDLNSGNTGIMLSGKYFISYEQKTGKLYIRRNDHYVENFWGTQVRDCFAIVGENGSGKTMLANRIMDDILRARSSTNRPEYFLIIVENDNLLSIYYSQELGELILDKQDGIKHKLVPSGNGTMPNLTDCEVAYFHNALDYEDYTRQYARCAYDFSLGRMIRHHHARTTEMHYDHYNKDAIRNYYEKELFRVITFLYDFDVKTKLSIVFPMPNQITIKIADDAFNEEHIMKETKERKECKNGEVTNEQIHSFQHNINNILKVFGQTWRNCTIKNLVLNCYKELCLSQENPEDNLIPLLEFFNACEFLDYINPDELTIYECTLRITENLRQYSKDDIVKACLDHVENFIEWLKNNETIINKFRRNTLGQLTIPTTDDTKTFMLDFISLYSKTSFAFPFYDFSFGLSTGEYYFVTLFSNLYSMISGNNQDIYVYDYSKLEKKTKNLLLIFDEAELCMHPRWQRMYMKWLVDSCEQLFNDISIKIIITTHSPIILSDFPANSVLYLRQNREYEIREKKTFGSDIHSLYLDSFFLEDYGIMGAFAEEKINKIADRLLAEPVEKDDYERTEKAIEYIGEGVIKDKLLELLSRKERRATAPINVADHSIVTEALAKLKEQRNYMDQLIKELEEKTDDKNRY